MAARWGGGEETLTLGNMEFFSGSGALQCHALAEDEICAELPDLSLSLLDTGELLGTFQGYVDPSVISIIEDSGTQGELQKFLNLSQSPMECEVFSSDNQWRLGTDGSCGTIGKVEDHSADENWDAIPIRLDNSTPKRCSKSRNARKSARPRVPEESTQQRSDGEEEEIRSPKQECSTEANRDFVDIGMEFSMDMINDNLQPKSKSGQRTPCVFNTEKVTLCDLVKYMHPYCLPTIAVCLEPENEEISEEFLHNAVVLEIVADGDNTAVPVVVQLSEPGFADCGTEIQLEENCTVKGMILEAKNGSSMQAYGTGIKHETEMQAIETFPRTVPRIQDGGLSEKMEPEAQVQEKRVTLALVKPDEMSLKQMKPEVQVRGNPLKNELEVKCISPLPPMEPKAQIQEAFVKSKSGVKYETPYQQMELKTQTQESTLKCESTIQRGANSQAAQSEEQIGEMLEGKVLKAKNYWEHGKADAKNLGNGRHQIQNNAEKVQRCERSRSRPMSKHKKKSEDVQNCNKLIDNSHPKSNLTTLQENVQSKNKLQKANQQASSHVNCPLLQESDFLIKHLEKVKKESEMELRSIKACRVKGRSRANMDSSLIAGSQDRKVPLEPEKSPEKSIASKVFAKLGPVGKETKRLSDHVLMNSKELVSEHTEEMQLLIEVKKRIDTVPQSVMHQESSVCNEAVLLVPAEKVCVVVEDKDRILKQENVEEDKDTIRSAKDTKPKPLSLKEYRMRMKQRKPSASEKTAKEKITTQWPSIPEPPTELAEIPCLLVSGSTGSLSTKPIQTSTAPVVEKMCDLGMSERVSGSPALLPSINNTPELAHKIVSQETSQQNQTDPYSSHSSSGKTVSGIGHFPVPYTLYADAPTWPHFSTQPISYPCLPPLPIVPATASGCPVNTFQRIPVPPPPVPPMPLSAWLPPPFPPPPIGTVPLNTYGAPGWNSGLPPPPSSYWSTPVPSVMLNDRDKAVQNPARISFPANTSQRVDCSINNKVNVNSPTNSLLQHTKVVRCQESSVMVHEVQSLTVSDQNKQVQIAQGQKTRKHNIQGEKHLGPVEGDVESLQSIHISCSLKEEVKNNSEVPARNASRPVESMHEDVIPKTSMKYSPDEVASPKEPVQNLMGAQSYTTGTNPPISDLNSGNNVVFKIMELLKKMNRQGVSAKSQTTQGTMALVPDTLQVTPGAAAAIPARSQYILEAPVQAKPQANLGAMVETAVVPPKPQINLGITAPAAAAMPSAALGITAAAAMPSAALGITAASAALGITEAVSAPGKPPTNLRITAAASAGPSTNLEITAAPAKSPTTPRIITAATPAKPPTTPRIITAATPAKPHTVRSLQQSTGLKKSQKNIIQKHSKPRIVQAFVSEVGIEASDVTSLLEQFEESEAKKEVCHSQSPGDKLAVGNSGLENKGERKPCNKLLAPELASTAGLTPPATPPHQLWKPLAATSLLGKAKPPNAAPQEGIGCSAFKTAKLIEAKPLPKNKIRRNLPVVADIPSVHVGLGDHDYCLLGQTKKCVSDALPVAEAAPQQSSAQFGRGTRLNIKHHQTITIKPIVSLKERLQNKQVAVAEYPSESANQIPCSEDKSSHQREHAVRNNCTDQLDHRTSESNDAKLGMSQPMSVLMSPEASPCRSKDVEVRRTHNLRGNASASKRSLRCYRKRRHSPSPQASSWRSRRAHTSRSCSSCSDSDSKLSSSSSSSRGSHSRSRSPSSKRRNRYQSRSSCSSRFSSRSSSESRSRSRGRSSSDSCSSSRSSSTSYSRSRSRSCSPYSRRHRRRGRRYSFYDSRDSYQRQKLYHKELAIEERRVVYIGKIHSRMTRSELKHRFSVFGDVEDCTIHFREKGDNYGFVTYRYTEEAFTALENGHKLQHPGELPFDLCFGGRRQFCRSNYTDLDSNKDDFDPVCMKSKFDSLDFDTLLKQAQKSHRR
ncbi:peroxisome proliferator-activated receptor gamma coactivator-related protein 1 isoform X2 [Rhinatrema bivittatum]|uniref:peroxisome proliferator-activated receptor gamma coactivator-related protein 1 isoform X2 n=1 Tax=Rhinatrema bivittatum TaxID=194408 RepID=UPI00112643D0|nr:peroxisome proliferator-activated receptor gamma coactivator-related protein 1 isoform X2 [Rhinatrema bivittatum]